MTIAGVNIVGSLPGQGAVNRTDEIGLIAGPDTRQWITQSYPILSTSVDAGNSNSTLLPPGLPLTLDSGKFRPWAAADEGVYGFLLQTVNMIGPGGSAVTKDAYGGVLIAGDVNSEVVRNISDTIRGMGTVGFDADLLTDLLRSPRFTYTGYSLIDIGT